MCACAVCVRCMFVRSRLIRWSSLLLFLLNFPLFHILPPRQWIKIFYFIFISFSLISSFNPPEFREIFQKNEKNVFHYFPHFALVKFLIVSIPSLISSFPFPQTPLPRASDFMKIFCLQQMGLFGRNHVRPFNVVHVHVCVFICTHLHFFITCLPHTYYIYYVFPMCVCFCECMCVYIPSVVSHLRILSFLLLPKHFMLEDGRVGRATVHSDS